MPKEQFMNLHPRVHLAAILSLAAPFLSTPASRAGEAVTAETNRLAEIAFIAQKEHGDPFNDVILEVVFTTPKGEQLRAPAFWSGGRKWRARYSSPQPGEHSFRTVCSDTADKGLHDVAGKVEIRPYRGDNLLYRHGSVRIAADHRHFEHLDGTPFFWLGDTGARISNRKRLTSFPRRTPLLVQKAVLYPG
jgi:hypothetical protein